MGKLLFVPSFEDINALEDEGLYILVSQGRENPPITGIVAWRGDKAICNIVEHITACSVTEDNIPGKLEHLAYDDEAVRNAKTEEEAVVIANGYDHGMGDCISETTLDTSWEAGARVIYEGYIPVSVGDDKAAYEWVCEYIRTHA